MTEHPRSGIAAAPQLAVPVTALRSLTMLATGHLTAGQPGLAAALLRAGLLDVDPRTAAPDLAVADAGVVYAATLNRRSGPDRVALWWARYAHTTGVDLRGEAHEQTLHAADVLSTALAAYGVDVQAIRLRRRLVELRTARDGAVAASTVDARVRLAVAEHDAGCCDRGITTLTLVWEAWFGVHGAADLRSVAMLLDLAGMLDACGRSAEATRRTAEALAAFAAASAARPDASDPLLLAVPGSRDHAARCIRRRRRPTRSAGAARRRHPAASPFACPEYLL